MRNQAVKLHQLILQLRYQALTEEPAQEKLAFGVGVLLNLVVQSTDLG